VGRELSHGSGPVPRRARCGSRHAPSAEASTTKSLPPSLTLETLRHPHGSVPGNRLLAEPLYLTKHIERMGTGTGDIITRCRAAGLPGPELALTDGFVATVRRKPERAFRAVGGLGTGEVSRDAAGQATPEVAPEVARLARACSEPRTRKDLQRQLRLRDDDHFRLAYILPALNLDLLEVTIPEKPNSHLQQYRLTAQGRAWLGRPEAMTTHRSGIAPCFRPPPQSDPPPSAPLPAATPSRISSFRTGRSR
jgi:hypothetical protein